MFVRPERPGVVKQVEFVLHPTFTPNNVIVDSAPFECTRTGWGEFQITVRFKVGTQTFEHKHPLCLSRNSSQRVEFQLPATPIKRMTDVNYYTMHGRMAEDGWRAPIMVVECDEDARPGYNTMKAHEYDEDPRTLKKKIKMLANLLKSSKACMAYTGAGISTSSGIDDYASKAKNSVMKQNRKVAKTGFDAEPSLGHRCLTQLFKNEYMHHWVQQNHDGLPQKAGFPQHEINEIHGAWYDPSNPVVPMSGTLRGDLCSWMYEWEKKADLCIAMGTSLCGMNADRCVTTPGKKYIRDRTGYGAVIVGLQQTQYDKICSLRIFARIDEVCALLAEELKMKIPEYSPYVPDIPKEAIVEPDVFRVPYDADGNLTKNKSDWVIWDLREGQKMFVNGGPGDGFKGKMNNKGFLGHYRITTPNIREGCLSHGKGFVRFVVGSWWVETAVKGLWPTLPIKNQVVRLQRNMV